MTLFPADLFSNLDEQVLNYHIFLKVTIIIC